MTRDELLATLREHWAELQAMGVESLALFGSFARDEARPDSDADLLVEFAPGAHVGAFALLDLKEFLERLLGRKVDLVPREGLKPRLRPIVEREQIHVA